jgi:hypothetical protein
MIKIERSTAVNPTFLRNGTRQRVTLNMTVTADELASLQADSGSITYSVDELEVKTVDFRSAVTTGPIIDTAPAAATLSAVPAAKPIIKPARKTAKVAQA